MDFTILLIVLIVGCALLRWYMREESTAEPSKKSSDFSAFQFQWLLVYLTIMCADWLMGPYLYAIYAEYGYDKDAIAVLYLTGFSSSMFFGTFVGSLADKFGRKKGCMLFAALYTAANLVKLVNNYQILLVGHLLSGVGTSLLHSVFEAWMVYEHKARNFDDALLSSTFSLATFGNGVMAIVAGLIASWAKSYIGITGPFVASAILLVIGGFMVFFTWTENYGDSKIEMGQTITNSIQAMKSDKRIPMVGIIQSLFEASMYTFVFMWSPTLAGATDEALPYGIIFSCLMVCIMIGSSIFSIFMRNKFSLEKVGFILLALSAASFLALIFVEHSLTLATLCFVLFEVCCGMYFPCFGTLRGKIIPEETRSGVLNLFRVPLNILVVLVLVKSSELSDSVVFAICGSWLLIALGMLYVFCKAPEPRKITSVQAEVAKSDSEL